MTIKRIFVGSSSIKDESASAKNTGIGQNLRNTLSTSERIIDEPIMNNIIDSRESPWIGFIKKHSLQFFLRIQNQTRITINISRKICIRFIIKSDIDGSTHSSPNKKRNSDATIVSIRPMDCLIFG